jgi:hypothetical protein
MAAATRTIGFALERTLRAPPERVWPIVSDTDAFNEAIGMAGWTFVETPDDLGGSVRVGSSRLLGTTIEWIENPFDWVVGQGFRVRRDYRSGPVRSSFAELRLAPAAHGGTHLLYTIDAEPRGTLWKIVVRAELRRLEGVCARAFDHVAAFLSGQAPHPYPVSAPRLERDAPRLLASLESRLPERGHDRALAERLVELLRDEPDRAVERLNPVKLASAWGVSPNDVLRLMFEASRVGALEPTWDMVCPLCRGAKHRLPAQGKMPARVYCPSCAADYDVLLDETVELSFRPSQILRVLRNEVHCIGGPGNTRHILVQQGLEVGGARDATLPLAPGLYRLRSPRSIESRVVRVVAGDSQAQAQRLDVRVDRRALQTSADALAAGRVALHLENRGEVGQVVELERIDGPAEAVSGLEAYQLTEARDLLAATIDCASFGTLVELAAAGALTEAAQEALDRHMAGCAACTGRFSEDREALTRLALALERRDAEPPPFEDILGLIGDTHPISR